MAQAGRGGGWRLLGEARTDLSGLTAERTVHPLGLVSKGNVWYLLAHTEAGLRTFRIGRVRSAVVTDLPAVRPADFDLADAWQSVVAHVRELRTQIRVSVRLDHRHVWPLRAQFGDDLSLIELASDRDDADDRVTAIIGGPSVERIAEHLAGWGAAIEVLDPPEVREHLVTIARQLLARYAVEK